MTAPTPKITQVPNRLAVLLKKPGGVTREQALQDASGRVEKLRARFVEAVPKEITALEAMLAVYGPSVPAEGLEALLNRAGQILTLSGTFNLDTLDVVVKRFCDFAIAMLDQKIDAAAAPLHVHLRAMRLVSPGAPSISAGEIEHMMSGLARVHSHYGIAPKPEAALPEA